MPVIATNTAANTAVRYLNNNSIEQSDSLSKLASGSRITKASDDAAGLAIATRIQSDVSTLEQASTNASHSISILQTADGGASRISDILERMKTLASQSASGTVTDTERAYIQAEFSELQEEIDGIAQSTRYNGSSLLSSATNAEATGTTSTDDLTTAATNATTTGSADLSSYSASSASLSINGTAITIADGDDASDVVTAINAQSGTTNVTASLDSSNQLVLTSTDTAGYSDTITVTGDTTDLLGAASDAQVDATGTDAYVTDASGGDITFDVNGETVTLSSTGGTNGDGLYSADDLVDAINNQVGTSASVTASLDADNNLVITSTGTASSDDAVTVDNFSSGDATDFGFADTSVSEAGSGDADAVDWSTGISVVVGSSADDTIALSIDNLTTEALSVADLDISTQAGAEAALDALDAAIDDVSGARAEIGAVMSRFEFRQESIQTSIENLDAAQSVLADVDIAAEQAKLSASTVKVQAAVAAASQANQMPQNLLSLLQ
ncbi:MAG: hypothetical protein C0606_05495 [Hyphomicrobiales bacterium]|nr:MAG: hypothetical protein C0606_05495 [Hyphomicrobiales bacterium]